MGKNNARWIYRVDKSYSWDSALPVSEDQAFQDSNGKVRLIIEKGGRITVMRGYSWNGCSPKVYLFDLVFGTPDGVIHASTGKPKTYFASMVHDALYQFLNADSPIRRREADACFLHLMAASDFSLRYIYWAAVRVFGCFVWLGKRYKRIWGGKTLYINSLL